MQGALEVPASRIVDADGLTPLTAALFAALRRQSQAPVLVAQDGTAVTGAELLDATRRAMKALPAGSSDVALVLRQDPASIAVYVAMLAAGKSVVLIDPRLRNAERQAVVEQTTAQHLIDLGGHCDPSAGPDLSPQMIVDPPPFAPRECSERTLNTNRVGFATAGTTGAPKLIWHDQQTLYVTVDNVRALQRDFLLDLRPSGFRSAGRMLWLFRHKLRYLMNQRVATTFGLCTISGHMLLLYAFLNRWPFVLLPERSNPREVIDRLARQKITVFAATPGSARQLVVASKGATTNPSYALLVFGIGGAVATPELIDSVKRTFACEVPIGYGSTESAGPLTGFRPTDSDRRSQSVGRALRGIELRVVREDQSPCKPGEVGRIAWRQSSHSSRWIMTNDRGFVTRSGYLHVAGRTDDVIVRGGQNIDPHEIERILEVHPLVGATAVVSKTDPDRTQVVAFVEPTAGSCPSEAALLRHVRRSLAPHKRPDAVILIDHLPRTPDGKIRTVALRERLSTHPNNGALTA